LEAEAALDDAAFAAPDAADVAVFAADPTACVADPATDCAIAPGGPSNPGNPTTRNVSSTTDGRRSRAHADPPRRDGDDGGGPFMDKAAGPNCRRAVGAARRLVPGARRASRAVFGNERSWPAAAQHAGWLVATWRSADSAGTPTVAVRRPRR
jgi:hypothetical protein